MDVIIVCHTEFGFVKNNTIIFDKKSTGGVTKGVNNLVNIADKYGAKITFAVCPEVVDHFPKVNHEVGLHIHPGHMKFKVEETEYYVGDEFLWETCNQTNNSTVLADHPFKVQLDLIRTGKEYVSDKLCKEVNSFVAGRWSINNDTIKALIKTGITHECSATPSIKTDHQNWSRLPRICVPYTPHNDDYQKKGDLNILILPISQTLILGSVNPESVHKFGLRWLKACFLEYSRSQPLFHICLHSPSMTDHFFLNQMAELIKFMSKRGANFKFVSETKKNMYEKNINIKIPYMYPYLWGMNYNAANTLISSLYNKLFKK